MEIIQTPEDELELLPLAMLTDIDRPRVTQAAIVRQITPQWCSPPVARLYRMLKDEPDDTYWMIWVHTQLAGDKETLERFHKAMTQVSGVNLTLKTIAKNLKERYINNETQRLMGEFILAETMKKKQDIITQLQKALNTSADDNVEVIDMAKRSAPVSYLLSKDDVGFAPRKEICAVKGRAKHGKTHLLSIFMAAIMQGQREEICGVKATQPDLKILYVDTEQSTWSSEHILETAMSMAGVPTDRNSPQLTCINLRKTLKARRKTVIEEYISSGKFDVVMVDGIKDLCTDFNDLKEADQLMVDVLAMVETYNVAFVTVLHENPTGDTSKMRGHLGTEVENKAFEVFQSKKIDDVFNITNTERRAKNVKTFAFKFNDDDELESCEPNDETKPGQGQGQKSELNKEELNWNQMINAFKDDYRQSHTKEDLIGLLARHCDIKESTAKNRIRYFYDKKWLKINGTPGEKGARYYIAPEKLTEFFKKQELQPIKEGQLPF